MSDKIKEAVDGILRACPCINAEPSETIEKWAVRSRQILTDLLALPEDMDKAIDKKIEDIHLLLDMAISNIGKSDEGWYFQYPEAFNADLKKHLRSLIDPLVNGRDSVYDYEAIMRLKSDCDDANRHYKRMELDRNQLRTELAEAKADFIDIRDQLDELISSTDKTVILKTIELRENERLRSRIAELEKAVGEIMAIEPQEINGHQPEFEQDINRAWNNSLENCQSIASNVTPSECKQEGE